MIAAVCYGLHPQGHRHRRAAAAASSSHRRIVGVSCRAVDGVVGLGPQTEFRRVRLSDDHAAGALHALDIQSVARRNLALEERRPHRCREARRIVQVFDRLWKSVQRPQPLPACELRVALGGLPQQQITIGQRYDRAGRPSPSERRQSARIEIANATPLDCSRPAI